VRVLVLLSGVALTLAASLAACTAFTPAEEPTTNDGGALDASSDGSSPPRFCDSRQPSFLCDDFDNPADPAVVGWAPWDRLDTSGGGAAARGPLQARSAPFAFHATANGVSRHILQKAANLVEKHLVWTFDVRIDRLLDSGRAEVIVAEVAFTPAGSGTIVVGFIHGSGDDLDAFVEFGSRTPIALPALAPKIGEWSSVRIEFVPKSGAPDRWSVAIGGAQATVLPEPFPSSAVALGLGAHLFSGTGEAEVRIDDVVMTLAAP
jgi:hypothetical protein